NEWPIAPPSLHRWPHNRTGASSRVALRTSSHKETRTPDPPPEAPHSPAWPWDPSRSTLAREPPHSPESEPQPGASAPPPSPPPPSPRAPASPLHTTRRYWESPAPPEHVPPKPEPA